ncbi:MAG TPA: hypothetical protein VF777_14550 [Phycisphaerales bacterium]
MHITMWSCRRGRIGFIVGLFGVGAAAASAQCQPQWKVGDQQGLPGANAVVNDIGIGDPDGAGPIGDCVVAVGQFTFIGDARTYGMAYWNPNAQSGSGWVGMGRTDQSSGTNIYAVSNYGSRIIIGGIFGAINPPGSSGPQPTNVAAWDGAKWVPIATNQTPTSVTSFATLNFTLYAASNGFNLPSTRALYRYTPGATLETGSWTPLLPDVQGQVNKLAVFNNELYLFGNMTRVATPNTRFQVAKLNGAGTDIIELPSLGNNNGTVYGGIVYQNELYIYGTFTISGGAPANCNFVAKLNGAGNAWIPTTTDASIAQFNTIGTGFRSAAVYDGRLVLGTDNTTATPLRSLLGSNGVWTAHTGTTQQPNFIVAMHPTPDGQRLAMGGTGSFNYTDSSARRFAFWTRSTNTFEPPARGLGDSGFGYPFVEGAGTIGSNLYLGGSFEGIGASSAKNLARWDGTTLSPAPGAPNSSIDRVLQGVGENAIYLVGSSIGLRRYDGSTTSGPIADNTPGSYSNGVFGVQTVSRFNGELVIGGNFSGSGGKPSFLMRRVGSIESGSWQSVGGVSPSSVVSALTTWSHPSVAGGVPLLVATGSFTQIGALTARVGAWDGTTWRALGQASFTPSYSANAATNLLVLNGDLYMSVYANGVNGTNNYPGLIRYDPATDLWVEIPSPRLGPNPIVTGFGVPQDAVVAFGSIWMATRSYQIPGMSDGPSVLRYDGTKWSTFGGFGALFPQTESIAVYGTDIILTGLFGAVGTQVPPPPSGVGVRGVISVGWARLDTTGGPPAITGQPQNRTTCLGGGANFTVAGTTNNPPLGYTWQWKEATAGAFQNVVSGANGRFNAANIAGATLNISGITKGPSLQFRTIVSDACSGLGNGPISDFATLTVCDADLANCDALVDDLDFQVFVVSYDILDCADPAMPAQCPSDLNNDGFVDDQDFQLFVVAYDVLICE